MGDEAVFDALHGSLSHYANYAKEYRKHDVRRQVQMLAAGLRGHLNPLEIEEDDEKVTIMMKPCGSGGRAILNGYYEGPPKDFLKVKKPQIMTFGRDDFPVYCCHCAFQGIIPIETEGLPTWVTVPSEKLGEEPCKFIIYKDPDKIPAEYYEIHGKTKGAAGFQRPIPPPTRDL